jgi:uncharacterized lipoprotein NlpE involved in copper resistance
MKKLQIALTLLVVLVLIGCKSTYSTIITVTQVVDSGMKQWSRLANTGQTTPAFNAKVVTAHDNYRKAAAVAQLSLIAYKNTSNATNLVQALSAAKDGALPLVDLIVSVVSAEKGDQLRVDLAHAQKP